MNKIHELTASDAKYHSRVPTESRLTPSPEFLRRIAKLLGTGQGSQSETSRDHNPGQDDSDGLWHDGTLDDD